jgi:hypothetical protein
VKIYTKVVIQLGGQDEVVEAESFDYFGPVAEAKGPKAPKAAAPQYSVSGKIVEDLYGRGDQPLKTSLGNILKNPGDDPFTQRQLDVLTQRTRGGFGARGLAGSGIAQASEQQALSDFLMQRGEQKQNQAIQILGTGNSSPTQVTGTTPQPRGFLGLK